MIFRLDVPLADTLADAVAELGCREPFGEAPHDALALAAKHGTASVCLLEEGADLAHAVEVDDRRNNRSICVVGEDR